METTSTFTLTVGEVVQRFNAHAEKAYRRRDGTPTREHKNFRSVLKSFAGFAGDDAPASKINRHQVRAWMDQLAAEELTRGYVNQCLTKIRTFVRWAADLDLVPISCDHELRLVRPLQAFRTRARESAKQTPPALSDLARVRVFLAEPWRSVCQLSELTGARPSELLEVLNAEVHLDGVARLTPLQHKTAHKNKQRVIPLTAPAVALVERFWRPFCPADPLFASKRRTGSVTISGYRTAFIRAAREAGLPDCRPYDVRRAVGRSVRAAKGLDAAQAVLGHAQASTTEIYAPIDASESETFQLARRALEGR